MQTSVSTTPVNLPFVQVGLAKLVVQNLGPGNLYVETAGGTASATTSFKLVVNGTLTFTDAVNQSGVISVLSDSTCDVRYIPI